MKPLVSFVLPTFRDNFLDQTIKSLKQQTLKEFEVLVFNNKVGRTLKIDDPRFKIINTDNWSGAKCYNEAKKMIESQYILVCHDDDICFPDRALISYLSLEESNIDLFYGSYVGVDRWNRPILFLEAQPFSFQNLRLIGNFMPHPTIGYRKDAIPNYREDFFVLLDYAWLMDCYYSGAKFGYTTTPLIKYRIWRGQISVKHTDISKEETNRLREIFHDPKIRSNRKIKYLKIRG